MSYRAHEDAWVAAVTAAVAPWGASTYDAIPSPLPVMYAAVSVTRRAVDGVRFDAQRAELGWRLQVECFGTTHREVQWLREQVMGLMDRPLPAIGASPLLPDGDPDEPDLDEKQGRWGAVDSYVYTAPNPRHTRGEQA